MPKHIVYSLMATGLWGFWAVFAKLSADRIGHYTSALVYSAASLLTVTAVYMASGQSLRDTGLTGGLYAVVAGVLSGLAVICFQRAVTSGPLGTTVALTALYPAIPVVFGLLVLAERLPPVRLAGVGMAIGAVFLLTV